MHKKLSQRKVEGDEGREAADGPDAGVDDEDGCVVAHCASSFSPSNHSVLNISDSGTLSQSAQ